MAIRFSLPDQTGKSGDALLTDGFAPYWGSGGSGGVTQLLAGSGISLSPSGGTGIVTISATGGGGSPGGSDTQVQFNDMGTFGGDPDFIFQKGINPTFGVGDLSLVGNGTTFTLDDPGQSALFTLNGSFDIQDTNNHTAFQVFTGTGNTSVTLGANGYGNHTTLALNDTGSQVAVNANSGLYVADTSNNMWFNVVPGQNVQLGDIAGVANSTRLEVDDQNQNIAIQAQRGINMIDNNGHHWFTFDPDSQQFDFGDLDTTSNGTSLRLDGVGDTITAQTGGFTVLDSSSNGWLQILPLNNTWSIGNTIKISGDELGQTIATTASQFTGADLSGNRWASFDVDNTQIGDLDNTSQGVMIGIAQSTGISFSSTSGGSYTFPTTNGAGVLTNNGSGLLTWASAGGPPFTVVDGFNIFYDSIGNPNMEMDGQGNLAMQYFSGGTNTQVGQFYNDGTNMNLDSMGNSTTIGDVNNVVNQTKLIVDDPDSLITANGNRGVSATGISFTGSGPNDMSEALSTPYFGPNNNTYTVTITAVNVQIVRFSSITGTFNIGDSVTAPSGATGDIFAIVGSNYEIENVTGTLFVSGDVISNGSGASGTANFVGIPVDCAISTTTDSITTPITTDTTSNVGDGVTVSFGSTLGHTVSDQWSFTYSFTFGRMLSLNGQDGHFLMGDLDNIGLGTSLSIIDSSQAIKFTYGTGDSYTFPIGNETGGVLTNDGSGDLSWGPAGGTPGGMDTQVQYNDAGSFGGDSNFTWDYTNQNLFVGSGIGASLHINNSFSPYVAITSTLTTIGDTNPGSNDTLFTVDDNAQTITAETNNGFDVEDSTGSSWFNVNPTGSQVSIGPNGFGNGVNMFLDDAAPEIKSSYNGHTYFDLNFGTKIYKWGDIDGTNFGTTIALDDNVGNILNTGTVVETAIGSTTYGGTLNYSAGFGGKARAYFNGSHSGTATGLLLPTGTNAVIGTKFTIDDLGGLATTDPITLDAGMGNTITSPLGVSQTFILNSNGTSVSIIKLTSTQWMVE